MFRLRRFARHPCISYWQRIITASGRVRRALQIASVTLSRGFISEATSGRSDGRPSCSSATAAVGLRAIVRPPAVIGVIARADQETFQSRGRKNNAHLSIARRRGSRPLEKSVSLSRPGWKIDTRAPASVSSRLSSFRTKLADDKR